MYVHAWAGHGRNAGAETTAQDMLRALVAEGWDCEVRLSQPVPGLKPYDLDGVAVYPLGSKSDITVAARKSDLILSHLECSMRATYIGHREKIPVAQVIHNTHWQTAGYLALGPDIIAYNTDWVRDHHEQAAEVGFAVVAQRRRVRFQPARRRDHVSCVVHPAIDPDQYRRARPDSPFDTPWEETGARTGRGGRRGRGRRLRPPTVLLVNLWKDKGVDTFYALAERMKDVRFVGVRGGYGHQEIREMENVTILPNTPDIAGVYGQVDVCLMPSFYESFGRVAIEAAASGIPCVAAPTPGLIEALGPDGLFAPIDDLSHWETLLRRVLTPGVYEQESRYALSRSEHWDSLRKPELETFVEICTSTAKRFRTIHRRMR